MQVIRDPLDKNAGALAAADGALGDMFEYGEATTKDFAAALAAYEKACNAGYMHGCTDLGLLHERARGVHKDMERAQDLYEKACTGGDEFGCKNLARIRRRRR